MIFKFSQLFAVFLKPFRILRPNNNVFRCPLRTTMNTTGQMWIFEAAEGYREDRKGLKRKIEIFLKEFAYFSIEEEVKHRIEKVKSYVTSSYVHNVDFILVHVCYIIYRAVKPLAQFYFSNHFWDRFLLSIYSF